MDDKHIKSEVKKVQIWAKFSQIGIQMALTIGLGTWLGYWFDGEMGNQKPIITIILSLCSIGVAMFNVIRQLPKEED